MYLCREAHRHLATAIGNFFGGRDHATVLHAYDKINKESARERPLHKMIKKTSSRASRKM